MARVVANEFVKGLSGIIGDDLCFRQIGGRTFVVKRPRKRPEFTENQGKQRSHFSQAVYYARTVLKDPAKREEYAAQAKEANLRSAYLAAMQDAMRNPEITSVYTESYHGKAGDPLVISVAEPFKITEATVTIKQSDGTLIETGNATRHRSVWVYKTVADNRMISGTMIIVAVKDRPGKADVKELIMDG